MEKDTPRDLGCHLLRVEKQASFHFTESVHAACRDVRGRPPHMGHGRVGFKAPPLKWAKPA